MHDLFVSRELSEADEWELDVKGRSLLLAGGYPDPAAMLLHRRPAERESDPDPSRLGGVECLEDPPLIVSEDSPEPQALESTMNPKIPRVRVNERRTTYMLTLTGAASPSQVLLRFVPIGKRL